MRKVLFRGKRVDNGEWIFGCYAKCNNKHYILTDIDLICKEWVFKNIEVIPKTVGEYTSLTDKNGTKIFEGDIVQWTDGLNTYKSSVEYCGDKYNYPAFDLVKHDYECNGLQFIHEDCCVEVIGNIYDNPELLRTNK